MAKDKAFDAGDEGQVDKRKFKAKLQVEREREEMRQVLSTRHGRNVIWRILARCGVYQSVFDPDAAQMCRKEGGRQIGIKILEDILTADEKAYILMMREQDHAT